MLYSHKNVSSCDLQSRVFQKTLLSGVSLIAAYVVAGPMAAQAQNINVVSSTPATVQTQTGFGLVVNPADASPEVVLTGSIGILNPIGTIAPFVSITGFGEVTNAAGATSSVGVENDGALSLLVNGGTVTGLTEAIKNTGGLVQLDNLSGGIISANPSGFVFASAISNSGSIGTLSNSGQITGAGFITYAIANDGTIGTISNNAGGTISSAGYLPPIYNAGTIDALVNAYGGLIIGNSDISNSGSIGTLSNNGLITAASSAISNNGTIGIIENLALGTIKGNQAIFNLSEIGSIGNAGLLTGITAISNYGSIAVLDNIGGGTINGSTDAISSSGTIVQLLNDGLINGHSVGISNIGSIGTISNTNTIIGQHTDGIYNGGSISQLSNSGTISGGLIGISNNGWLATLTNGASGSIYGGASDIYNQGSIALLSNSGRISGGTYGVDNKGKIATLSNLAGGYIYGSQAGLNNGTGASTYASIGTLSNSGTIVGGAFGVSNAATIGTLDNLVYGTISGPRTGVVNSGSITLLSNSGVITGTLQGIYNHATITTLSNQAGGTISSPTHTAIYNTGNISQLSNSGVISGHIYGIDNISIIGTLANASGGVITASLYTDVMNFGSIGVLSNSGTLTGGVVGVQNQGTIGWFVNSSSGTISVSSTDIYNLASIATITNNDMLLGNVGISNLHNIGSIVNQGYILSKVDGISNGIFGTITTISNLAGGTISGKTAGIYNNRGFIGAISNSGTIIGVSRGIYNAGVIAALTNSGLIEGSQTYTSGSIILSNIPLVTSYVGIVSTNYIGKISNLASGQIAGTDDGIYNSGTIGGLTNAGLITAVRSSGIYNIGTIGMLSNSGTISGGAIGIDNRGAIGAVSNSGLISGPTGLYLATSGTTITNTGTIVSSTGGNAINFEAVNSLVLSAGSDIIGTIYGGGTASSITLEGSDFMSNPIADFGAGSSLTIVSGADWGSTGNWSIASVTNNGSFTPGLIGTSLNLTGNYSQSATGSLIVLVTPKTSSLFAITGNAALNGNVTYDLAPGIYGTRTYTYLTTTGTISGGFTSETLVNVPAADYATYFNPDPSENLIINTPFSVKPVDQSIFADQTQALAAATQDATSDILGKATEGGSNANPACAAQSPLSPANAAGNAMADSARIASTLANVFCGEGGWVEATGSLNHVDASGGAAAYDANTAGFLAGVDRPLNAIGTRLGLAVGFDQTSLTDKAGGSGSMSTTRVALYGSQSFGAFTLAATVGYGFASNSTSRNSGVGNFNENNSLGIINVGAQLSTHVSLGGADLAPAAGLKVANVEATNFSEPASGLLTGFAVAGKMPSYTSVQLYFSLRLSKSYLIDSNIVISPDALVGYEYEAGDNGIAANVTFASGPAYQTTHSNLDRGDALVSAGLSAGKNNWSLFATYTARLSGNWTTQTGEAGLRIKF